MGDHRHQFLFGGTRPAASAAALPIALPIALPSALVVSEVLIYRDGIAAGLARIGDLHIVGAVCAADMPRLLAMREVQIVFLDISRAQSRDAARAARALSAQVQVIGFGMTSEDEGLAGAEAGVTAFVDHDGTIEDLNRAARDVLGGVAVCPPQLTARLLQRVAQLAGRGRCDDGAHLTRREREIAALVEEGLSNKEIACSLNISPATVKNHVHMILDKLQITRRRMIAVGPSGIAAKAPLMPARAHTQPAL